MKLLPLILVSTYFIVLLTTYTGFHPNISLYISYHVISTYLGIFDYLVRLKPFMEPSQGERSDGTRLLFDQSPHVYICRQKN